MKKILIVLLLLIHLSCQIIAQQIPLRFQSSAQKLYVLPDEQLIICTKAGEVAMTDSLNGLWHFSQIASPISNTLDNANFFNRDTGFVSGFIYNDRKYNIIYHTQNGGKSWSKVDFGTSGWADCAWNLPNGEAWMTIGGEGVVYSKDYGFTWKKLAVYDAKQRYHTIFFNQQHEGMIGSVWNTIAYTKDNCYSWEKIPTPLDQQAYNKTDKSSRPTINKVCIYKDLLLVIEEGMVFYTKKDSIHWKLLPDYISFSTDAANTALYLINSSQQVVKTDEQLQPLQTTATIKGISDLFTRNGQLFVLANAGICKVDTKGHLQQYPLQTIATEDIAPSYIYTSNTDKIYGAKGNMIFIQTKEKWKYAFSLPFTVTTSENISINKNTVVYTTPDSLYYYDIAKQTQTVTTTKDLLTSFIQHQVTTVIFSEGSNGCFHSYSDNLVYKSDHDLFVLADNPSWGGKHTTSLKPEKEELSREKVAQFVKEVCLKYNRCPVIKDLEFSEADYQKCKADIKAYQNTTDGTKTDFYFHRNNIDFDKLLVTVDSIRTIDSITLNNLLPDLNHFFSTTTNWISVTLENEAGKQLSVQCSYSKPNAFYIPWIITINGGKVASTSPVITAFFQYACPSLLKEHNKVPVLHNLVRNLYK